MNEDDDTEPDVLRGEEIELWVEDTGVGWAELSVSIGPFEVRHYGFSLVFDPLDDIRNFANDLSGGSAARMMLRGEPGGVEVVAQPDEPEGWVRLRVWTIDFRNDRDLYLDIICPAQALSQSLRARTGFLAKEHGLGEPQGLDNKAANLWGRLTGWLIRRREG